MLANDSESLAVPSNVADSALPFKTIRFAKRLLRYGISLTFLIIPATLTYALKSHPTLNPIISLSFIVAVGAAAWWGGVWAGILTSCATIPVLTLVMTNGKSILPPRFDWAGLAVFWFISILVSRVASNRRRIEQRFRVANAQLENRVDERTGELPKASTAIQHRLAELESLYAELPVGVCFLDTDLRFVRINENLAKANRAPANAHLGRKLSEMVPKRVVDLVEPLYRRVLVSGEPLVNFEFTDPGMNAEGRERAWMVNCSPVRADKGTILGLQVIVQDITDRKHSEHALRAAHAEVESREEQFRILVNAIPQLCWMADGKGAMLWCNERCVAYTGLTLEQIQEKGWAGIHEPQILPAVLEKWHASLASGEPFEMEFPIRALDGRFRWFLTRILPVKDERGAVIRWFGTATDIDELKQSREALLESEARFRAMADSAPVMIWVSNTDKAFTWFNRPWLEFSGCTIEQELSHGWLHGIHPDDKERCGEAYRSSFDDRKELIIEYRRKRWDGQWRWVLGHSVPRWSANGGFLGYIGCCLDIHERKEMEENLRRANRDLQQFAYSASHDLQEPIRTIAIYSQLIERRHGAKLDESGQEYLRYLSMAAKRIGRLVQDLLSYTQLASIEAPFLETADGNAALHEALGSLSTAASESGAQITSDELPAVRMSGVHLQQLFQNLIGNAIKYRGGRSPHIHIAARQQDSCWVFSVRDDGIGIDPYYKERIFGIFKRLHTSDQYSGTGIGLAICQRIVERYGGRIWVDSEPGKGSTFFFTVPC